MRLRHKLILGIITAAVLPAMTVAWLHSVTFLRNAESVYHTNALASIQSTTKSLDDLIQNAARDIRSFIISPMAPDGNWAALSERLAAYTYAYPYFSEILWVSPQGKVLASSDPTHNRLALAILYAKLADNLAEIMRKPAWVLHISDFDDVSPTQRADIMAGRLKQEALTLQFLLRVGAENGNTPGVLVAVMNNQAIITALQDLQQHLTDAGPVMLLNRHGEILLSSDPRTAIFKRHPLAGRIEQELRSSTSSILHFDSELDGKETGFIIANTLGIGLSHSTSWRVLTTHSDASARAAAMRTLYRTAILLAAIIFAGGLLSLLLARSIVRPIDALSAAAARIRDGDLEARAPSAGNDEIGDMGRTFNTMAGMVEAERRGLEQRVIDRTAALEQARHELEQANRGKDEFLAAISHELRTPLNHILGFSGMLKDGLSGELNAEQKDMAQDIFDAGNNQLAIINALIELARLQAGKVKLQAEQQDPAKMLGEIAARHAAKAGAAGLAFSVEAAQGLGEMPLDREAVTRLLDLLLENAFKFTPPGGKVSLVARRVPRADVTAPVRIEAGEYLELAVADNGPGIAPEILPRLFQPFVQGDGRLARRYGGTGIGLVLVRLLAELHGGGCGVESEPGAGAKFLVWLPCGAVEAGE